MPKRNWTNGFATGLLIGLLLVVLVYVCWSFLAGEIDCRHYGEGGNTEASHKEGREEECSAPQWWVIVQGFVSSEDTLAQWIMAVLSLAAVGVSAWAVFLVKDSLYATNLALGEARASNDISREIGEAQVRAYITCVGAKYAIGNQAISILLDLKNTGQSPAVNIYISGTIDLSFWPDEGSFFTGEFIKSEMVEDLYIPIAAGREAGPFEVRWSLEWGFGKNPENRTPEKVRTYHRANKIEYDIDVTWQDIFNKYHTFKVHGRRLFKIDTVNAVRDRQYEGVISAVEMAPSFDVGPPSYKGKLDRRYKE